MAAERRSAPTLTKWLRKKIAAEAADHRYNTRNPEMATRTWLQWKVAAKIWLAPTPTNQLRKKVATEKWLGTTSVYVPAEA